MFSNPEDRLDQAKVGEPKPFETPGGEEAEKEPDTGTTEGGAGGFPSPKGGGKR